MSESTESKEIESELVHDEEKEGSKPEKKDKKAIFMKCMEGCGISFSVATAIYSAFQQITTSNVLIGRIDELTSRLDALEFEKDLISGNVEAGKETARRIQALTRRLQDMEHDEQSTWWASHCRRLYNHFVSCNDDDTCVIDGHEAIESKYKELYSEIDQLKDNNEHQQQQNEELVKKLTNEKQEKLDEIEGLVLQKGIIDGIGIVVSALVIYKQYNDLVSNEEIKKEAFEELEKINKVYIKPIINCINDNKSINEKLIYKAKYKLNKLKNRANKYIKKNRELMVGSGINILRTAMDIGVNTYSLFNKSSVLSSSYKWMLGGIIGGQSLIFGGNCYIFKLAYDQKCDWENMQKIVLDAIQSIKILEVKCKKEGILIKMSGEMSDSEDEENEFKQLLQEWNLKRYIESFEEEKYMDVSLWEKVDEEILRDTIGMKKSHIEIFLENRDKHFKTINTN